MSASVLVSSVLLLLLAGYSVQYAFPEAPLGTGNYQGGGRGYPGSSGQMTGGYQGGRGLGADSRFGFNIVDTQDRYGYEASYPGGRASYYLLGQNRGPGQQRSRVGYA